MKKRLISLLLVLALLVQFSATALAGVVTGEEGLLSIVDENGDPVETHTLEEWEEEYPYGIFAFKETQINLKEDAADGTEKGSITVYRIGGTKGKAAAIVTLYPAVVQIDEDILSYANAAGIHDYRLTVEKPWPIAEYQLYGGEEYDMFPGVALTVPADAAFGSYTFLLPEEKAEDLQWQMLVTVDDETVVDWEDIEGATSETFIAGYDLIYQMLVEFGGDADFDFRCTYELGGVRYCSKTAFYGESYIPTPTPAPEIPEDFVNDQSRVDTEVLLTGEEYGAYSFAVVFAEDEWEKEITFEALGDVLHESAEVVTLAITDSLGADVNLSACTASVAIEDDEEALPSAMGFSELEIWADKSAGVVRIPLYRETEAPQYVTGADFETVDGTAIAGRDYAVKSGTTQFVADFMYTYIEIELVNDMIELAKENSGLYFTVKLTGAKGGGTSTLIDGKTEVRIRLYNSASEDAEPNIPTDLYSPDEEDLTGSVGEGEAIVPSGDTVIASAELTPENLVAEYHYVDQGDGISAYEHTYDGALSFDSKVYGGDNYWKTYAVISDPYVSYNTRNYDNLEGHRNDKSRWTGAASGDAEWAYWGIYDKNNMGSMEEDSYLSNYSNGWLLESTWGGHLGFYTENFYERYESWDVMAGMLSEKSNIRPALMTLKNVGHSGNIFDDDPERPINVTADKNLEKNALTEYKDVLINKDAIGVGFVVAHPDGSADPDEFFSLLMQKAALKRRLIDMPYVRIHTADDDYITQDVANALYESIKPTVSLVAGKGGVAGNNAALYNNTTLQVTRNNNASSYRLATNDGYDLNSAVFYSSYNSADEYTLSKTNIQSGGNTGTITLLQHDLDGDGEWWDQSSYLNVVMDRVQNVYVELAPSVPRLENKPTEIDPSKISQAWRDFRNSTKASTTPGFDDPGFFKVEQSIANFYFDDNSNGFYRVTPTMSLSKDNPTFAEDSTTMVDIGQFSNLHSINFGLPEEDLVVFNGVAYKGNEDIPITADVFMNENLTFYYYDSEYLSATSTMVASIARIERYIDLNNDGVVKGSINGAGAFTPAAGEKAWVEGAADNSGATYYALPSITEESYSITELAPRLCPDPTCTAYHQIVLKVYYSLLPRCLVLPEGASEDDRAEIIPAAVSAVTQPDAREGLSAEQKGYRYLNHNETGGHLMYGAEATRNTFVDVPLGGDRNPAYIEADKVVWEPSWDWGGENSYLPLTEAYPDPQPIYLDGTVLGDRYAVGAENEVTGSATGPSIDLDNNKTTDGSSENIPSDTTAGAGTLTEEGKAIVRHYLASFQENDTIALCVREDPDNIRNQAAVLLSGEPMPLETPAHTLAGIESSRLADFWAYPSSASSRQLSDPFASSDTGSPMALADEEPKPPSSTYNRENKQQGFDTAGADGDMPEYNMAGQIALPNLDFSLTDTVNIATNGQEIAITLGFSPLSVAASQNVAKQDHSWDPKEVGTPMTQAEDQVNAVKSLIDSFRNRSSDNSVQKQMNDFIKDMEKAETKRHGKRGAGIKAAGVEADLSISISMILKWNPIENEYFFNKMMIAVAGGVQLSYTIRLTPCPIIYCTITVGISLEVAMGLEASRIKVIATSHDVTLQRDGWAVYVNQKHLGSDDTDAPGLNNFSVGAPGATFSVTTKKKAVDIHFNGTLYVDAKDANGNAPESFKPGTIRSDGEDPVTIKLAEKVDGNDNAKEYTVTFTVVNDGKYRTYDQQGDGNKTTTAKLEQGYAVVDRVVSIEKQTFDVYFTGVNISPSAFLEIAVGVGMELFKIELYINVTVGCSFSIYAHDSETYEGEEADDMAFAFNEFSMLAGVGLRVTALFFNFEFDAVQFAITYDRQAKHDEMSNKNKGWNFIWYAANKPIKKYGLEDEEEEGELLGMNIILPGTLSGNEKLYTPEDNLLPAFDPYAYDPSDETVPFQYSGYGTSGDAFALGSGMTAGSTYELITAREADDIWSNYLVYTVSDTSVESIDQTRLVLSKVQETADSNSTTGTSFGLTHPLGGEGTYLVLDSDKTGDLDFDAWVDAEGKIHVAWVSYTDAALAAYNAQLAAGNVLGAMRDAGKHTAVKTVTVDAMNDTKGDILTVSDGEADHGIYTMPSGATSDGKDMIFWAEAIYYDENDPDGEGPEKSELDTLLENYAAYYGGVTDLNEGDSGLHYGTGDPSANFQLDYKEMRLRVFGKSFYPTYAVVSDAPATTPDPTPDPEPDPTPPVQTLEAPEKQIKVTRVAAKDWIQNGVQLENADLASVSAEGGNAFMAAYTTTQYQLVTTTDAAGSTTDEQAIKKLYLQKIAIDENGSAAPESAVALRKMVDYAKDSTLDGAYTQGARLNTSDAYVDPYFANVRFLNGKLGGLTGTPENFDEIVGVTPYDAEATAEDFLIFEMNGNTYVVPEADLFSITDTAAATRSGSIIPFFTRETAEQLNAKLDSEFLISRNENTPAVTNVTIGADGNGNISAVYTQAVPGAPGNAVYLTKYDANSKTWGLGVMLAMRDMQTWEDSIANDWDEKTAEIAYYDTSAAGSEGAGIIDILDAPLAFNFNKLAIGLAGKDKLLVVTEGTLMQLEAVEKMVGAFETDEDGDFVLDEKGEAKMTGLTPAGDEIEYIFNAKQNDDGTGYDSETGVYALSFGMGAQGIGTAALHLSNYDFTPGSPMRVYASFVNSGDVAIRASEDNPAKITLYIKEAEKSEETVLATWNIKENVRSGQKVETEDAYITLPASVSAGDKLYFRVEEDKGYITQFGGSAFDQNTLSDTDNAACVTVRDRAELGYERFDIRMVSADDTTVTLSADIQVGNRGSKLSEKTYLRFQYEDHDPETGTTTVYPVDLTDHNLSVSAEEKLNPYALNTEAKTLANGYLELKTHYYDETGKLITDNTGSRIRSMYGRTVTGTFTVPKTIYDTDYGTGSLNLIVTVVSCDASGAVNEEYDPGDNIRSHSVEQKTLFATVPNFTAQQNSTLRIPITMQTSTVTEPSVTVTELSDDGEKKLAVLYYDKNHEAIVVIPNAVGEGKIRVADIATHSFYDICYVIEDEGTGLNVYEDNGIFTFYDDKGNAGDKGKEAWDFRQAMKWSEAKDLGIPLRSDLAYGDIGEAFSFRTQATAITFYFMGLNDELAGKIEISDTLEQFETKYITSSNGSKGVTVQFNNHTSATHTVTVDVVGGEGYSNIVRFDKIEETFAPDMTVKSDPTAPDIYFSRSPFPANTSIPKGKETPLTVYFTDLGGLSAVTVNAESDGITRISDTLWAYSMILTENGEYRFIAIDTAGNVTERDLSVMWFNETDGAVNTDPGAPSFTVGEKDIGDGKKAFTLPVGADVEHYVYDDEEAPANQYFMSVLPENGEYVIGSGIYRVSVTENGITGYQYFHYDAPEVQNTSEAVLTLKRSADNLSLLYTATQGVSNTAKIKTLTLNGQDLLDEATGYNFTGRIPITGLGTYELVCVDEKGKTTKMSIVVSSLQITFKGNAGGENVGGDYTQEISGQMVEDGTNQLSENRFVREGYSFKGWSTTPSGEVEYKDGAQFVPTNENHTLYAVWEINQYTVTFNSAGGSAVAPITQDYKTAILSPADPERTGYTFAGWSPAVPASMPAENVTLTALWTINQYTISFDSAGGTDVDPITKDYLSEIIAPDAPERTGYTFTGWTPALPSEMPAENLDLTATWQINEYTVTFNSAGGSAVAPITQNYLTAITPPDDPERTGYTFIGWSPAVPATMPAEDVTLTAIWQINEYTISFDSAGGTAVAPITQDYLTAITPPADPEREGYIFGGWSPAVPATMPAENVTLTAIWIIRRYTITWLDEDGTILEVDENVPHFSFPRYDGRRPTKKATISDKYTFAGWEPEVKMVTGDATYHATYDSELRRYDITWRDEDGTILEIDYAVLYSKLPTYDGPIPEKAPTESHTYVFDGWTRPVKKVTGKAVYTAKYKEIPKEFTVTWQNEDGTILAIDYGVPYGTVPAYSGDIPTKAAEPSGYFDFVGWDAALSPVTGDVTYTAVFDPVMYRYTVIYQIDGVTVSEQTVTYGEHAIPPVLPAREGYTNTAPAWDHNGRYITEDTVITAVYTINRYTVTFMADGNKVDTQTVAHGENAILPAIPAKNGYTVTAPTWDHDGERITSDTVITAIYTADPGVTPPAPQTPESEFPIWGIILIVCLVIAAAIPVIVILRKKKADKTRSS